MESFGNIGYVNILEHTQQSIDMNNLNNLTNFTRSSDNFSGNRTQLHNQKDSQLCHSFAVVSALRTALLNVIKNLNLTDEKRKQIQDKICDPKSEWSFKMFLVNFVGNVNPRSYQGLLNSISPNWSAIELQTAELRTVIDRLVRRTTFEIDGWKRILAIREIFNHLHLNIDDYKMEMETVKADKFEVQFS